MTRVVPYTAYRNSVYYLLKRARKFHSTMCSVLEFDLSSLMAAREALAAANQPVSLHACLIKATSLTMRRYPRLNHHLFHGLFGKYEVDFEEVSCNLLILRREAGEYVLLPTVIERSDELTVQEIDEIIRFFQTSPLEELPQMLAFRKLNWAPNWVMRLISYKLRSDHRFYRRFFGTYAYSPLIAEDEKGAREDRLGFATSIDANSCTTFHPCSLGDMPIVIDGRVVPRKTLTMTVSIDHYLVDAHDGMMAMRYMRRLLDRPKLLGLPD